MKRSIQLLTFAIVLIVSYATTLNCPQNLDTKLLECSFL